MTIDGKPYTHNYLEHSRLMQGCNIRFVMGDKPNKQRGISTADRPYSFSASK